MSAETHLAKIPFTIQQAKDFIFSNTEKPEIIFQAAFDYGVTTEMLSEITGFSTDIVREYFASADIDSELDSSLLDNTSILVNSDLGSLESLVAFNERNGILSNTALREEVELKIIEPLNYELTFDPVRPLVQPNDDIYDAEELGVAHLTNVPATNESVESLFYGSLINLFSALDESELNQINTFPSNGGSENFQALLLTALSETPSPVVWDDEKLADLVTNEAASIINKYGTHDNAVIGVLDLSFLGLATA